jgi:hypothetical protein
MSFATNLVGGDDNARGDIFLATLASGSTRLISQATNGGGADWRSDFPVVARHAVLVGFVSEATNLAEGDVNDQIDAFVWSP